MGDLSAVIYYKNHDHPTFFNDYDVSYKGVNGTMILFPSDTLHHVMARPTFQNCVQKFNDLNV